MPRRSVGGGLHDFYFNQNWGRQTYVELRIYSSNVRGKSFTRRESGPRPWKVEQPRILKLGICILFMYIYVRMFVGKHVLLWLYMVLANVLLGAWLHPEGLVELIILEHDLTKPQANSTLPETNSKSQSPLKAMVLLGDDPASLLGGGSWPTFKANAFLCLGLFRDFYNLSPKKHVNKWSS